MLAYDAALRVAESAREAFRSLFRDEPDVLAVLNGSPSETGRQLRTALLAHTKVKSGPPAGQRLTKIRRQRLGRRLVEVLGRAARSR